MSTIRHALSTAALLLGSVAATQAHPGHSHADFASVLGQPWADWQHAFITIMSAVTAGVACHFIAQAARTPAAVRWAGSACAAIGAAWLMN